MWSLWLGRWVCSEMEFLFSDLVEGDGEWKCYIYARKLGQFLLFFFLNFSPRRSSRNTAAWLFLLICLFLVVLLGLWVCKKFRAARRLLRILQSVCFGQSTDSDTPPEPLEIADRRGCTNRLSQCHVCVVSCVHFTSNAAPFIFFLFLQRVAEGSGKTRCSPFGCVSQRQHSFFAPKKKKTHLTGQVWHVGII